MSIAEFSAALKKASSTAVHAQATKMMQELLEGSNELFSASNPLSIRSGASILSKDTISVPYAGRKNLEFSEKNLTDTFREQGEAQGNTALNLSSEDLLNLFSALNVSNTTGKSPIELYIRYLVANFGTTYKAKHFEFYLEGKDGNAELDKTNYGQKLLENVFEKDGSTLKGSVRKITAFRGLNFSHANALTHVASFLHYCRTGKVDSVRTPAILSVEKEITSKFHRGHVLAQTTGRGMMSTSKVSSILVDNKETNPILLLVELSKRLDIVSSGYKDQHKELLAASSKDFSGDGKIRMNISFQLIRTLSGVGNLDTGDISTSLALISTLQSLILNISKSQTRAQKKASTLSFATTPVINNIKAFSKTLDNFLLKLSKDNDALYKKIGNVLKSAEDAKFLLDLRTSDSILDYIGNNITNIIRTGKPIKALKVSTGTTKVLEKKTAAPKLPKLLASAKALQNKILAEEKKVANKVTVLKEMPIRNLSGQFYSLVALQILINESLPHVIAVNMGNEGYPGGQRKVLNYRTGRFASSAKVERLSQSREGMITAFYTYMKNPYATFSEGGAQSTPKTRDPKLLISTSIREIAATKVGNRMRAVSI